MNIVIYDARDGAKGNTRLFGDFDDGNLGGSILSHRCKRLHVFRSKKPYCPGTLIDSCIKKGFLALFYRFQAKFIRLILLAAILDTKILGSVYKENISSSFNEVKYVFFKSCINSTHKKTFWMNLLFGQYRSKIYLGDFFGTRLIQKIFQIIGKVTLPVEIIKEFFTREEKDQHPK